MALNIGTKPKEMLVVWGIIYICYHSRSIIKECLGSSTAGASFLDLSNASSDISPETVPCKFWSLITDRLGRKKKNPVSKHVMCNTQYCPSSVQ